MKKNATPKPGAQTNETNPVEIKPSSEDMSKINKYTRRALRSEEVYIFNIVLCDNETDRDNERFTVDALKKIAEIFIGRTGIFDHSQKGENQTARIYDASLESATDRKASCGDVYHYVKASAYMVRSKRNQDLILEIDGGIKKEVSLSCQVAKRVCSVCGVNRKVKSCSHIPGRLYGGKQCCLIMDEPTDAYEWSFVAIPSQVSAGVVKKFECGCENFCDRLCSRNKSDSDFAGKDVKNMDGISFEKLKVLAKWGESYRADLAGEVVKLSFLAGNNFDTKMLERVVEKMDVDELKAFKIAFEQKVSDNVTPVPVLSSSVTAAKKTIPAKSGGSADNNREFRI
ncbi:MAG: hypothetical protein FWG69_04090 [Oscillospiraceae bacterium]|nr:hypothetical protein [Oscillospiraceae bacterium]